MKTRLTARQREILEFLDAYTASNRFPPSLKEAAAHFGVACSTIAYHLEALRRKGRLRRSAAARSIVLTNPKANCRNNCPRRICAAADADAGRGNDVCVFAPDDVLSICGPERLIVFAADDDSMFDLGIHCGDAVLAVPVSERKPAPGDIVLAVTSGGKMVIRSYFPFNSRFFELVPAHSGFSSERYPTSGETLRGVVISLSRRF